MIADDDASVLESSEAALREAGFKVVRAEDGCRAIEEALRRKVSLVVLDVSMRQMGGVEVCHCLKAMPKTSKIPIVLTAHKKDPAAKTLAQRTHGSVRVLRKPYRPEELVSVARELAKPKSFI